MNRIIPVASGKGGVGKSFLTVNLGVTLARMGKTVILVDLDLGCSNLHTFLGIRNTAAGIGNYLNKQCESLEELIIPTSVERLFFIPGDGLFTGAAQPHYFQKMKIIKELPSLVADYILLDLGAGTSHNIVDYYIPFNEGIVVTVPETTAILNAYSFMKSALSRSIFRSYPPHSPERAVIKDFFKKRLEGSGENLDALSRRLAEIDPSRRKEVEDLVSRFYPGVIINMGRSEGDRSLGSKLRSISRKNLGMELQYLGYVEWMPGVSRSINSRRPYCLDNSDGLTRSLEGICRRLENQGPGRRGIHFEGDADLDALNWKSNPQ